MPDILPKKEQLDTYSEEVQEIVGQAPKKIVRWSITFFILVLLAVASVCFFVKYSDILPGSFTLTATDAPKTVIARRSAKLVNLLVQNNDTVKQGQVLAWLESTASHAEVLKLSGGLELIWEHIRNEQWDKITEHQPGFYSRLGTTQSAYQTFISAHIKVCAYLKNGMYTQREKLLKQELDNLNELNNYLADQEGIYKEDYLISQEDFKAKEYLHKEKVIPLLEYKQEQSKLLAKRIPIDNIRSSIVNNNTLIANKKNELIQLEKQFAEEKSNFLQALNTLISNIEEWKQSFLLMAPVSGTVTWPVLLHQNQDVKSEQELFYISPFSTEYFGEMHIAQENFGKLKSGQDVFISLAGYPYAEYGKLRGKVSYISPFPLAGLQPPGNGLYYVSVTLTNGLKTDMDYSIPFKNGLSGSGEVIVNKTRLVYKFLRTIREVINKPRSPGPSPGQQTQTNSKK
jgi:multidrug resistance efflux pump